MTRRKSVYFLQKEASEDLERELQKFCHVIKTDAYENVNVSEQDYILKPADTVISEAVFTSASMWNVFSDADRGDNGRTSLFYWKKDDRST